MSRTRKSAALALLLLAAACASKPPPPPEPTGPPPGVDGRYRGTARLVRGDRFCPKSGPRVYEVTGGVVTLAYSAGGRSRVPLTAPIQPDGRIQASDGAGTLEGQLKGDTIEVTIASRQCEHRWTLRKVP